MEQQTKYCKHCGEVIDIDCVICPKCGKQVEALNTGGNNYNSNPTPIIINNSSSSSSSAAAAASGDRNSRRLPWHLTWTGILIIGTFTGGIYFVLGFIMRSNWLSRN